MFQILINVMLGNTDKAIKEFIAMGGAFNQFEKRRWYLPFRKVPMCQLIYKDKERVFPLKHIYRLKTNTQLMDWLSEVMDEAKSQG